MFLHVSVILSTGGVSMVAPWGGMCGCSQGGACVGYDEIWRYDQWGGRYASYWNAFLYLRGVLIQNFRKTMGHRDVCSRNFNARTKALVLNSFNSCQYLTNVKVLISVPLRAQSHCTKTILFKLKSHQGLQFIRDPLSKNQWNFSSSKLFFPWNFFSRFAFSQCECILSHFASCIFPLDPLAHAHAHPTHSVHFCYMNVVEFYPLFCKTCLYHSIDGIQLLLEIQALFTPTDLNIHNDIESQITQFKPMSQWLVLVWTWISVRICWC